MNELLALEEYVSAHLSERVPARALVDMHQEVRDVPRRSALRAVAAIRRQARQAREMAAAAWRIRVEAEGSFLLRMLIILASAVDTSDPVTIYLKPGRVRPDAQMVDCYGDDGHSAYWIITVGAAFVLAAWRGLQQVGMPVID